MLQQQKSDPIFWHFKAIDTVLDQPVSIKVFQQDSMAESFKKSRIERDVSRLRHPRIESIYDLQFRPFPVFIAEYIDGGDLKELTSKQLLSPAQAASIGLQAADVLAYATGSSFECPVLRPSMLAFRSDGQLAIRDIWLAAAVDKEDFAAYAPPEWWTDSTRNSQTTVYSLGLILTEAATGKIPLLGTTSDETRRLRTSSQRLAWQPELGGALYRVLARTLQSDPSKRPTLYQLADQLRRAASELPIPEPLPMGLDGPSEGDVEPRTDETEPRDISSISDSLVAVTHLNVELATNLTSDLEPALALIAAAYHNGQYSTDPLIEEIVQRRLRAIEVEQREPSLDGLDMAVVGSLIASLIRVVLPFHLSEDGAESAVRFTEAVGSEPAEAGVPRRILEEFAREGYSPVEVSHRFGWLPTIGEAANVVTIGTGIAGMVATVTATASSDNGIGILLGTPIPVAIVYLSCLAVAYTWQRRAKTNGR